MIGARVIDGAATEFLVWAPSAQTVNLCLMDTGERRVAMAPRDRGYFAVRMEESLAGVDYWYELDENKRRADPASRYQPHGIHGPSQVVDFGPGLTRPGCPDLPLDRWILYELHVACFSPAGDFDGVIRQLDQLADLGINALQLMPIAQFPGKRNWGYDGVFPFAVQDSYGGPHGLLRLIDACHERSMAVALDAVYNHLGPEGNYLADFGPYFTDCYQTSWGSAINFDGRHADEVRRYFIENALYWIREFRVDALRLDAIQAIFDNSARPFLRELADVVHAEGRRLGRRVLLIAETNQNDARQITPAARGGLGLDAVWNDDFHHSLHARLTGERVSVYLDHGPLENVATAYRDGFVLQGQYSQCQQRRHGSRSKDVPANRFVVFSQSHDQIGNRLYGERLSALVPFEAQKLAAALVLLSPYVPMLFMGEEYGETAPFLYFVDHSDPQLIERVRAGRAADFASFVRQDEEIPDPCAEVTFQRSRLDENRQHLAAHASLRAFYKRLIQLRKEWTPLARLEKQQHEVQCDESAGWLISRRWHEKEETLALFYFGEQSAACEVPIPDGPWAKVVDAAQACWNGPGEVLPTVLPCSGDTLLSFQPFNAALYARSREA